MGVVERREVPIGRVHTVLPLPRCHAPCAKPVLLQYCFIACL